MTKLRKNTLPGADAEHWHGPAVGDGAVRHDARMIDHEVEAARARVTTEGSSPRGPGVCLSLLGQSTARVPTAKATGAGSAPDSQPLVAMPDASFGAAGFGGARVVGEPPSAAGKGRGMAEPSPERPTRDTRGREPAQSLGDCVSTGSDPPVDGMSAALAPSPAGVACTTAQPPGMTVPLDLLRTPIHDLDRASLVEDSLTVRNSSSTLQYLQGHTTWLPSQTDRRG
jgi:hypothetical protein